MKWFVFVDTPYYPMVMNDVKYVDDKVIFEPIEAATGEQAVDVCGARVYARPGNSIFVAEWDDVLRIVV